MLYAIAGPFAELWGPLRLFGSHLILLVTGTILAAIAVWLLLPALWGRLPLDRGKKTAADSGVVSRGKPTGAGLLMALIMLPIIFLVSPPSKWYYAVLLPLYLAMLFGYLDDQSSTGWGEWRKGILDLVVAVLTAACLCQLSSTELWFPFYKGSVILGPVEYILIATVILWLSMNATNCSDGVDGLAGTLSLISLFALGLLLYGVVGYRPIADYLLIPHSPDGARWAILVATIGGGLAGYVWHNAEPSRVLMGDAGSRFLGLAVGIAVLTSGNPFLIIVVSPVVLINGGTGLLKLILLRALRRFGFDIAQTKGLGNSSTRDQTPLVKALHTITFPLHDHCRRRLKWSNSQVLVRFALLQAFLIPLLFLAMIKIR